MFSSIFCPTKSKGTGEYLCTYSWLTNSKSSQAHMVHTYNPALGTWKQETAAYIRPCPKPMNKTTKAEEKKNHNQADKNKNKGAYVKKPQWSSGTCTIHLTEDGHFNNQKFLKGWFASSKDVKFKAEIIPRQIRGWIFTMAKEKKTIAPISNFLFHGFLRNPLLNLKNLQQPKSRSWCSTECSSAKVVEWEMKTPFCYLPNYPKQ